MYADDVKLFVSFDNASDSLLLQEDIDKLADWCASNCTSMLLNLVKCKKMTFSRRVCEQTEYYVGNYRLENLFRFNDLGVLFDSRLDFGPHIEGCVNKATGVLAFIKRWSKEFVDPYLTKRLFTILVRPISENACVIWSPSYRCSIDRIESVQKQFLIFALRGLGWNNLYDLPPYSSRLMLIDLSSLERRRFMYGIVFLTKLINGD
ncbi:uncharacterized protein LOC142239736 [Haematobia irritans]|uniref:uncharacterized protein LOC142239736 n=1 Tax=Haematobia irritans TaxID=7368 RepID=UPI003F50899B